MATTTFSSAPPAAYLKTLHELLVRVRWMAGEKVPHEQLYAVLDAVEILPSLLVEPTAEHLEQFRLIVADLGESFSDLKDLAERL